MKRLFLFFLCALTALPFVMAGGGAQKTTAAVTAQTADRSNLNPLGTFPLVKTKETINVWQMLNDYDPVLRPFEENWAKTRYEQMTGVHVNITYFPLNQFKERLQLALAAGEQIDLVSTGGTGVKYTPAEIMRFAEQKLIIPYQDFIGVDTIYLQKVLAERENLRETFTNPDGNMYTFPTYTFDGHWAYYNKLWVNTTWLNNLGLKIPTTPAEFKTMLIAFRDKDANGNGDPNDEIPLAGAVGEWWTTKVDMFLMSAFILDDGENRTFLENGKVVAAYTRPEFREGLRYLADLYKEKLLYADSFTMDSDTRHRLNSQKKESIIGAITNGHHWGLGVTDNDERNAEHPIRWNEYTAIPPLKGPTGLQITRYDYYPDINTAFIPATCRNPALVMRWLDYGYNDEAGYEIGLGIKGVHWTDADPGSTGPSGYPAAIKRIPIKEGERYYNNLAGIGTPPVGVNTERKFNLEAVPDDMYAPDGSGTERMLQYVTDTNYKPYSQPISSILPPLWYSADQASRIAMLTTNINTYVEESIARFITGQMNIETQWDSFQAQLKSLGIDEYLKIIQDTYDKSSFAKK